MNILQKFSLTALLAFSISLFFAAPVVFAEWLVVSSQWTVSPDFHGKKARGSISGAVCVAKQNPHNWCLAINDEKRYVQFFSLDGKTLSPKERRLWLLPKRDENGEKFKEIDAEAVAYHNGFIYVTGSHGLSRHSNKKRSSQYFVFRFPVNKDTGEPAFNFEKKIVPAEVERSNHLEKIIQDHPVLGRYASQPLGLNGANIEGLVVKNGKMHFGFRGPELDGDAMILSVNISAIFGDRQPVTQLVKLSLGDNTGIRDLAITAKGILVLSGPARGGSDEGFAVYFWQPDTGQLKKLATLPKVRGGKPEAILLISETQNSSLREFNIMILHDHLKNGAPHNYHLTMN